MRFAVSGAEFPQTWTKSVAVLCAVAYSDPRYGAAELDCVAFVIVDVFVFKVR
jgi:hypothetical protein